MTHHESAGLARADDGALLIWTGSALLNMVTPRAAALTLPDMARNLSRAARWAGTTRRRWTVADHCLMVENMAWAAGMGRPARALALMHDAAEAVTGDIPRPIKAAIPAIADLEARIWQGAIAPRLPGVASLPFPRWQMDLDNAAAAVEVRDLLDGSPRFPGLPAAPDGWKCGPSGSSPAAVEGRFLWTARSLGVEG